MQSDSLFFVDSHKLSRFFMFHFNLQLNTINPWLKLQKNSIQGNPPKINFWLVHPLTSIYKQNYQFLSAYQKLQRYVLCALFIFQTYFKIYIIILIPMTKNLMAIFCILAIFSIQSIVCEQIHRSTHLQTDLSNSQKVGFGDNNRLLSIVNIDKNEELTSTGQVQIQNPFIGNANAQDSNEKGYSSLKKYTKKNFYQYQVSANSGFLLNSQSSYYVDSFGRQINNLMLITGLCNSANYNPNGNYFLQFNPDSLMMAAFSIPLENGIMDGSGLYQSWVPLGDFIFPFIPYQMVVNGWCGIDNIGPKLNSTSTGYTIL